MWQRRRTEIESLASKNRRTVSRPRMVRGTRLETPENKYREDWVHVTPAMSIEYMVTPKRAKRRITVTVESLRGDLAADNIEESESI